MRSNVKDLITLITYFYKNKVEELTILLFIRSKVKKLTTLNTYKN